MQRHGGCLVGQPLLMQTEGGGGGRALDITQVDIDIGGFAKNPVELDGVVILAFTDDNPLGIRRVARADHGRAVKQRAVAGQGEADARTAQSLQWLAAHFKLA